MNFVAIGTLRVNLLFAKEWESTYHIRMFVNLTCAKKCFKMWNW